MSYQYTFKGIYPQTGKIKFSAENGPELVHADRLLSLAMDKYWKEKDSADGTWHFCIRTYNKESKVVKKILNVKPKFLFMT